MFQNIVENLHFEFSEHIDLIRIRGDYKVDEMFDFTKKYFEAILNIFCENGNIELMTLKPLKISLGLLLTESKIKIHLGKHEVLINFLGVRNHDAIADIIYSLDFEDSNICLIKKDEYEFETRISEVYSWILNASKTTAKKISHSFCFPEDDGYALTLVNSKILPNALLALRDEILL